MGFFDNFADTSGLSWVGKDEKEVLIKGSVPFAIKGVQRSQGQFGERFVATVELEGEDRAMSFPTGSVESRDRLLSALAEYLAGEDATPPLVYLERVGRSIIIRQAEGE